MGKELRRKIGAATLHRASAARPKTLRMNKDVADTSCHALRQSVLVHRALKTKTALSQQFVEGCDGDEAGLGDAALCLSRCYAVLGRSGESTRWKKFVGQHEPRDPFSAVPTSQIEASLKRPVQNPLTPQELECLWLSAHGQTSAVVGTKLGQATYGELSYLELTGKLGAMNRHDSFAKVITANYLRM